MSRYQRIIDEGLIRTQTGIKERYIEALKRSGRYLPIMETIFTREYGLPRELTMLPFIESSFNYMAYSSVGAAGIWQFMARTGRSYMKINSLIDERRDPIEATRAAARYLSSAHTRIGTWPLTITSYNHGVGGVISKARAVGSTDIVTLLESDEKRAFGFASGNFFPEFLAALEIHDDYQTYFPGLEIEPPLNVAQLRLNQQLSIEYICRVIGITQDELKSVNYAIGSAVWNGRARLPAGYNLKVPSKYASKLAALRQGDPLPQLSVPTTNVTRSSGVSYKVRKGDTLISLAKRFKTTVQAIRHANGLAEDQGLRIGETVLVPSATEQGAAVPKKKKIVTKKAPAPAPKKTKTKKKK